MGSRLIAATPSLPPPWRKFRFNLDLSAAIAKKIKKIRDLSSIASIHYLQFFLVLQVEKQKQDDALDDLSGVLGQLKGMACDMGSDLDR